jgi:L-malate glycosyltransferase
MSGDLWAGAEVMVYNLLKGLMQYKDLCLSVILLNEGKLAEELRCLNIPLEVFDEGNISFLKLLLGINHSIKRLSPDIIHSHRYKENFLAYTASLTRGTIFLETMHGMPEISNYSSLKHALVTKINFSLTSHCFDKVVAVSDDIRTTLVNQHGFDKHKVLTIHNGVDIPNKYLADESQAFVIGSSGRFSPVKDYPLMIEVAKIVCDKANNTRFELAGDGIEKERLLKTIDNYRLSNLFLLRGFQNNISSFYQELNLYISTSLHEGIPLSVLEAMAHGLPIVASKVGGLSEIITDGIEGYLVESRKPEAFAEKCLILNKNIKLRQKMGMAARDRVINYFSLEKMAENYFQLYMNTKPATAI